MARVGRALCRQMSITNSKNLFTDAQTLLYASFCRCCCRAEYHGATCSVFAITRSVYLLTSSSLIGLSASGGTHCNAHPRSCYNFTVFILASHAAVSVVDSVPRMSPTLRHSRSCSSPKRHCRQPLPVSDILSLTCSLSPRFSVLLFRCFEPLQPADSRARLFRACCHRAQPGFTLASPSPKRERLPWKM